MHEDSWVELKNGKVTPLDNSTHFYKLDSDGTAQQTYYERLSQVVPYYED